MFEIAIEVVGDGSIDDDHAAFIDIGGGMRKVCAIADAHDESDVRGIAGGFVAGDGADVAIAEVGLGGADIRFGDVGHWES